MRALALVLCLVGVGAEAATGSAAVDTFYVRPVEACTLNGDGMAYGCAASAGATGAFRGFANLIWTVTTGIDDGDTLKVCGSFLQTSANTANTNLAMMRVGGSGSAGLNIVVDGNCTAAGGQSIAFLDGDYTSGSGIRTDANTYLTFRNLDLSGAKDGGMTFYTSASGEVAVSKNIRVESTVVIHDIKTGAQPVGITWSGTDGYIAATVYDIDVDGLFEYSGGNWIIDGANVSRISLADTNGDCVQLQRNTDGDRVRNLYCDKTNVDSKQCVVASSLTAQTHVMEVTDMTCLMADGTLSIGVYSEGQMTVRRSYIRNPATYGLTVALNNSAKMTATSNIIVSPGTGCFDFHKTSAGGAGDLYNNDCLLDGGTYGLNAGAATATINFKNNSITGAGTYGIYRGASGTADDHNNVAGQTTKYSDNGAAGVAGTGDLAVASPYIVATPSAKRDFRLPPSSTLACAGTPVGRITDILGRPHEPNCTPIGAMVYGAGDARGTALSPRTTPLGAAP